MLLLSSTQPATKQSKSSSLKKLIQEVLSDSKDDASTHPTTSFIGDPSRPWRAEFLGYLETIEAALQACMSMIQWWGVSSLYYYKNSSLTTILFKINAQRYLVWASLS
jgi:hypothetical protein